MSLSPLYHEDTEALIERLQDDLIRFQQATSTLAVCVRLSPHNRRELSPQMAFGIAEAYYASKGEPHALHSMNAHLTGKDPVARLLQTVITSIQRLENVAPLMVADEPAQLIADVVRELREVVAPSKAS